MPQQVHYVAETQLLRRIANDEKCRFIWTRHAEEQMAVRQITAPDVEFVLMNGQVTLEEQKQDRLWRVEGTNVDGERIQVVVAVYEDALVIKIVTAF